VSFLRKLTLSPCMFILVCSFPCENRRQTPARWGRLDLLNAAAGTVTLFLVTHAFDLDEIAVLAGTMALAIGLLQAIPIVSCGLTHRNIGPP
jgi:hypothetical protein